MRDWLVVFNRDVPYPIVVGYADPSNSEEKVVPLGTGVILKETLARLPYPLLVKADNRSFMLLMDIEEAVNYEFEGINIDNIRNWK